MQLQFFFLCVRYEDCKAILPSLERYYATHTFYHRETGEVLSLDLSPGREMRRLLSALALGQKKRLLDIQDPKLSLLTLLHIKYYESFHAKHSFSDGESNLIRVMEKDKLKAD